MDMDELEFKNNQQEDSVENSAENKGDDISSAPKASVADSQQRNTIWQSYYTKQEASQTSAEQPSSTASSYVTPQSNRAEGSVQAQAPSNPYTVGKNNSYYGTSTSANTTGPSATSGSVGYTESQSGTGTSTTAYGAYTQNQYAAPQQVSAANNTTQGRQAYTASAYTNNYGTGAQNTSSVQPQTTQQVYSANSSASSSQKTVGQWGGAQPPNNTTGNGYASYSSQPPYSNSAIPKKPKKAKKTLSGISLVLVCLIAGFGGGFLGTKISSKEVSTKVTSSVVASGISSGTSTGAKSISEIAAKAGQSVVSIITENLETNPFTGGQVVSGAGSGVIMSEDGYIITNNHVVDGAQSVSISLSDGTQYPATVIGTDAKTDMAVIKIDVTGLTPVTFSDSSEIHVGDFCMAIGNPMGVLSGTVTDGIISALDREITIDNTTMNLLQMSAAVSPGNSGGGLFNENGDLVGVVNAKSSGEGSEGLGFAIPANTALEVANSIIENGYVTGRPSIGISVVEVTEERSVQGYSTPGVYVADVSSGGAGEEAGLQKGDRIISVDGKSISETLDISKVLSEKVAGDTVSVEISRNGQTNTMSVVLQELKG